MAKDKPTHPRCPICGCAYRYKIAKPRMFYRSSLVVWDIPLEAALCRPSWAEYKTITIVWCPNNHPFNRNRRFVFNSILEFHVWYYATISSEAPIDHLKEMQDQSSEGSEVDVHAGISPAAHQHGPNQ